MEVLAGVLPRVSCAVSQCSSATSRTPGVQSCPVWPILFPTQSSGVIPSLLGSSVSLITSVPPSLASNYNEFVNRVDNAKPAASAVDFDAAADFMSANPVALLAGVAAIAVPLIALRAYATPQSFGSMSAAAAFATLSDPEQKAQLLDIRATADIRAAGSPNLKSLRKKPVQVAYNPDDDQGFVDKVFAKFRDAENTTLYILDQLDGNSLAVAKLLANSGFERAYAIQGGVEGPNGWQKSELPWVLPRKGFSFNIDGLKNLLSGSDNANLAPTTVGAAAAAAGIGVAVFSEAETLLQLLGSAAFIQIFARKFMFADDREKTIREIQTFLDTKIAPKEFVAELKEVGRVLLPKEGEVKAAVASGNAALEKQLKGGSRESLAGKVSDQGIGA